MTESKPVKTDESVLSRWSRRKREAERVQADSDILPEVEQAAMQEAMQEAGTVPIEDEASPLTDADMPAIDTLTEESDFSGFMSPGVSDELRNLALRKLFHAPVFNIRDGLDEYDDDFTTFEKLGDIVTADMKHQMEMQQKKLRDAQQLEEDNAQVAAVDAAQASDYTDAPEDEVDDDFDDESMPVESADEANLQTNRTENSA